MSQPDLPPRTPCPPALTMCAAACWAGSEPSETMPSRGTDSSQASVPHAASLCNCAHSSPSHYRSNPMRGRRGGPRKVSPTNSTPQSLFFPRRWPHFRRGGAAAAFVGFAAGSDGGIGDERVSISVHTRQIPWPLPEIGSPPGGYFPSGSGRGVSPVFIIVWFGLNTLCDW